MIYFSSDQHFGHENAITFTNRPFSGIDEMTEVLIQNINDVVGKKDELYLLGDFAYKTSREVARKIRNRINCTKVHLINGNHDRDYSKDDIFSTVQDYKELKTEYGKFILFHYPILEWNAGHYGSVHLHGHIHSTGEYNRINRTKKYSDRFADGHAVQNHELGLRIYDVGVDANQFKPVSLQRIAEWFDLSPVKC